MIVVLNCVRWTDSWSFVMPTDQKALAAIIQTTTPLSSLSHCQRFLHLLLSLCRHSFLTSTVIKLQPGTTGSNTRHRDAFVWTSITELEIFTERCREHCDAARLDTQQDWGPFCAKINWTHTDEGRDQSNTEKNTISVNATFWWKMTKEGQGGEFILHIVIIKKRKSDEINISK